MDEAGPLPALPKRDTRGHKGTFGTVVVVGGSSWRAREESGPGARMIGGPALSARAALRSGAGLVRLVMPEPVLDAGLTIAPEATGVGLAVDHDGGIVAHLAAAALDDLMDSAACLVIGPGLGRGHGPGALTLRAVAQDSTPVVIDADALNALAEMPEVNRDFRAPAVLTPHVGEFDRLAQSLGLDADPRKDPVAAAQRLAALLGCVVVLKSSATAVSDGLRGWLFNEPNPALATAGSGDVLSGVIGSLIAQHCRRHLGAGERTLTSERQGGLSLFDAARLGVTAHARAGRAWADRHAGATGGLLASDLLDELPAVLEALRRA